MRNLTILVYVRKARNPKLKIFIFCYFQEKNGLSIALGKKNNIFEIWNVNPNMVFP